MIVLFNLFHSYCIAHFIKQRVASRSCVLAEIQLENHERCVLGYRVGLLLQIKMFMHF